MSDTEDIKKNKKLSKQEYTSESKGKSLCKELLSSEENIEKANYQVIHEVEEEDLFKILETEEGFAVVTGDYIMSRKFETLQQAKKAVKEKSWEIIINTIGLTIHLNNRKNGN